MKLTIKMIVLGIALAFGVSPFVGCDPTAEVNARYDAMTGEKLPEKINHLEGSKFESIRITDNRYRYEIALFRFEIEGHVYYSRSYNESTLVHAEACPCKTNNPNRVER